MSSYHTSTIDIDECIEQPDIVMCDQNANCTNTIGSYNCRCNPGYNGTGFTCTGTVKLIVQPRVGLSSLCDICIYQILMSVRLIVIHVMFPNVPFATIMMEALHASVDLDTVEMAQ